MTYSVNSIADYVIEYAIDKGKPINNLKLQKILYFLQARFLLESGGSLFDDTIEKWKYGPVVPEVYFRFNHLGAEDIKEIPREFNFMNLLNEDEIIEEEPNEFVFPLEEKSIVDDTIDELLKYKPFDLVDETHKHSSWLKDESRIISGTRNIPYNSQEILEDFEKKSEFQLWKSHQ